MSPQSKRSSSSSSLLPLSSSSSSLLPLSSSTSLLSPALSLHPPTVLIMATILTIGPLQLPNDDVGFTFTLENLVVVMRHHCTTLDSGKQLRDL